MVLLSFNTHWEMEAQDANGALDNWFLKKEGSFQPHQMNYIHQ
jgi:hypothetical protein